MNGDELYQWFEQQVKTALPDWASKLAITLEPTVTPEVSLAKITPLAAPTRPLVRADVRPEGVRFHFPVEWGDELSQWLGEPPADAYRLKSNWVHQPSIGVGGTAFEPFFKDLTAKIIEMLKARI